MLKRCREVLPPPSDDNEDDNGKDDNGKDAVAAVVFVVGLVVDSCRFGRLAIVVEGMKCTLKTRKMHELQHLVDTKANPLTF